MRHVGSAAIGVLMLSACCAAAQPQPAPQTPAPAPAPAPAPLPAQVHPSSACAASAANKHECATCPTCGHENACATCKPKNKGCVRKLLDWMSYRGIKPDRCCKSGCEPHHPPLYAWFPCQGDGCGDDCDGGCGSCSKQRSGTGILCRLHGVKNCSVCRGCPKGQCGAYWFVGKHRVKYPVTANSCGCSGMACAAQEPAPAVPAPAAAPPAEAPVDPLAALPIQQTAAFKNDTSATGSPAATTPPKPQPQKRISTYRPDALQGSMPVLSPEQFRKKPQ